MPKCIEKTEVYDDGTVKRWTVGEGEWLGHSQMVTGYQPRPHGGYGSFNPEPTITRPLRKATTFRGHPDPDGFPYLDEADTPPGGVSWCISSVCPDETFQPGEDEQVEYDYRFTVEAVRVEKT